MHELAALAGELHHLAPEKLGDDDERLSLWLNLYNALLLHEMALRPRGGNLLRHRRLFSDAAYRVGAHTYTLSEIEHGVLRRNRRQPYGFRKPFRRKDPRLRVLPKALDPRVHFALNCGARSCPPIRPYTRGHVDQQLEAAAAAYLRAEVEVDPDEGSVALPGLMKLYRRDFGDRRDQLRFAAPRLTDQDRAWLGERHGALRVRYSRFDWTMVGD